MLNLNQAHDNVPNAISMEKNVLSAMLIREGEIIPKVAAILNPDDFYSPENRVLYRVILKLYAEGTPPNILSIMEDLRKSNELDKIGIETVFALNEWAHTNAYAVVHSNVIKEKALLRKIIQFGEKLIQDAQIGIKSVADISFDAEQVFADMQRNSASSYQSSFSDFFSQSFKSDIVNMRDYASRSTGFANIDQHQFFSPGLYVIGATPAAGKTTFCWQLLEQLAKNGESCIFCSYEMSRLELFTKSVAHELHMRNKSSSLTAADIRRGGWTAEIDNIIADFSNSQLDLHILELQDESIDDLLKILKPLCDRKKKAPVVCLDYLQIVPFDKDSIKLGIDDAVRKLKKFQRDTNTTFIVISSFNRTNYAQAVSFESFKESGNIEYTADVVWALQLYALNEIKLGSDIAQTRKKISEAKKLHPRQIQLKCLKNRQGTNYDCFFQYYAAYDYFEPCEEFKQDKPRTSDNHTPSADKKNILY